MQTSWGREERLWMGNSWRKEPLLVEYRILSSCYTEFLILKTLCVGYSCAQLKLLFAVIHGIQTAVISQCPLTICQHLWFCLGIPKQESYLCR